MKSSNLSPITTLKILRPKNSKTQEKNLIQISNPVSTSKGAALLSMKALVSIEKKPQRKAKSHTPQMKYKGIFSRQVKISTKLPHLQRKLGHTENTHAILEG